MVEVNAPLMISVNDVVVDNDPVSFYKGRDVVVTNISDFGHCIVFTVLYDGYVSYALRSDKVLTK